MQFSQWLPIYTAILDDFGFSPQGDIEAAELLARLQRDACSLGEARARVEGRTAVIFGNAPCLEGEIDLLLQKGILKGRSQLITLLENRRVYLVQRFFRRTGVL